MTTSLKVLAEVAGANDAEIVVDGDHAYMVHGHTDPADSALYLHFAVEAGPAAEVAISSPRVARWLARLLVQYADALEAV